MITKYLVKMSLTTNPGAKVDSGLKLMCNTWFTILPVWLITWLFSWFQCNKYFSVTCSTCQERRNSHFKCFCSRNYSSPSAGSFLVSAPQSWVFYLVFHSPATHPTDNWELKRYQKQNKSHSLRFCLVECKASSFKPHDHWDNHFTPLPRKHYYKSFFLLITRTPSLPYDFHEVLRW